MNETELIVRIDRIYKEYEDSKRFDCKCRVYYKHKNNDLVIKCIPELPENISLDDNNNILITVYDTIANVINMEYISCGVGKGVYNIPVRELKIQKSLDFKKQFAK